MRETGSHPSCCFRSSCAFGASLNDLQQLWNDIGENEADKDQMILELEMQCLQLYQKKVEEAANIKARLQQSVAAKEAELATLMASLAEPNDRSLVNLEKRSISLKEKLASVTPIVEDLRRKKEERMRQFTDTRLQIEKISREISGYGYNSEVENTVSLDEADLSLRKLAEYETRLRTLQREKSERLQKVLGHVNEVHSLCCVLGIDFCKTVSEVHPSLQGRGVEQTKNISNGTLEGLERTISNIKAERKSRIHKVKDIVSSLLELWNLMDSSNKERNKFSRIASVLGSSECDISEPGILSTEMIDQAIAEVERLNKLKASRMKELVMKKRLELEAICRMAHIVPDTSTAAEKSNVLIDSGMVDPSELLGNIEEQIVKAKDEVMSRREIMERIDRWLAACEEESWLEEYNQDDNRYHSGRGAHINLKRAERARVTVTKIPAMIDNLINRTITWEDEKGRFFLYDGERLVSILDDYKLSRKRKQEEKKRQRVTDKKHELLDQKKLQDVRLTGKEAMYGSRPSPRKSPSFRKSNGYSVNGNGSIISSPRRSSVGSAPSELLTPRSYSGRENGFLEEMRRLSTAPSNFVAISKEDTISTYTSICGSESCSPPHV